MLLIGRFSLVLTALIFAAGAFADWIEQSNQNAMLVLRSEALFQPESVAGSGLSEFDGDVTDLSAGYEERKTASDKQVLDELGKRLKLQQDPRVREDLQILIQYLQDEIESLHLENEYLLPYNNIPGFLFASFRGLLDPRNDNTRYDSALERLRKYNGTIEGYIPITELAIARSTERFEVAGLLGPYRGEVEQDLASLPHLVEGIRAMFEDSGLEGWQEGFALLQTQMVDYATWLEAQMLPRARVDYRLPPALYTNNLKDYGVRASPEQLISEGQYAYQLIRMGMKPLARQIADQRGWDDKGLISVLRRLKLEQIPPDQVLTVYQQRLAQLEKVIRREDILTLPQRGAAIRLATDAESAASPASFMDPPQLINNTGQYGEFVLVQTNPTMAADTMMDDWSHEAITWALTAHEARPGHELQFAAMVENGISLARALFAFNSANAEGWGLYAESIVEEYMPLEGQLFCHYLRLMRAARMFLDPMINTGQLAPSQAENFLVEQLALSRPMARSEVNRYTFRAPGQATSYYYGYMNIMRLRSEVEIALGDSFSAREFHDFILQQGLLPPEIMRQAVLGKFVAVVGEGS